jgi:putative colanic acid biosynthesis glycosyltransferase
VHNSGEVDKVDYNQIRVLQINSSNSGSTGNIMLNISKVACEQGFIFYFAYANSRNNKMKTLGNSILISNIVERNLHLKLAYYSGFNDCFSTLGTKAFLKKIDKIKPDIIHLHNLHNCYINLRMLFRYIKAKNIPVVWTLHDCWAFTGKCPHFTMIGCNKWKTGCFDCPQFKQYPETRVDKTLIMYKLKNEWFTGVENLAIVTPSQWLADKVAESFLGCYPIKVINNGIDLNLFKPTASNFREKYGLQGKRVLLGVADIWSNSKGLNIFTELSKMLDGQYKIVLVGLSREQIKNLPSNVLGLLRINCIKELAEIYSAADLFINPSIEETMGLVTIEALACGTPVIVSNSTAVPEMINPNCGVIVEKWNVDDYFRAIEESNQKFLQVNCINHAKEFDVGNKYSEYVDIYYRVVGHNN